jgi:arsenate reductase (glutaredoxin)
MLIVYTLATCDTCRRALRWLRANQIVFEERAIRATPPTLAELRSALPAVGGDVRKLFNRSGREYRAQDLATKLPGMTEGEALAVLAGNGSLLKRPFAVGDGGALVGFDEAEWARILR